MNLLKGKNILILVVMIILGFVIGGLIAASTKNIQALSWLSYGTSFGIDAAKPATLDLTFLKLVIGLEIRINVAEAICIIASILFYRKIA